MRRLVPLLLTAFGGFILIVAYFIPAFQWTGEFSAICFDILAAIAMILGGGNLLKVHLKKVSDQAAGWGYSIVTLVAFLITLAVGLGKVGIPPAEKQENFGVSYAPLALADFPLEFHVEGQVPQRVDGAELPPSARWQTSQEGDLLVFRGWMTSAQARDLIEFKGELKWKALVEGLYERAQPPVELRGKASYNADHQVLAFTGSMTDEDRQALLALGTSEAWKQAVKALHEQSNVGSSVTIAGLPSGVTAERITEIDESLAVSIDGKELSIAGPMTPKLRGKLGRVFPVAPPATEAHRKQLHTELANRGEAEFTDEQETAFRQALDATWTVDGLVRAVEQAAPGPRIRSYREMYQMQLAGEETIEPEIPAEPPAPLTDEQKTLLRDFAVGATADASSIGELIGRLQAAGEFVDAKVEAVNVFFSRCPTVGQRNVRLFKALASVPGEVSQQQRDYLLEPYREQAQWEAGVNALFAQAHRVKYAWSGTYNAPGTPFLWIYEFVFKALTATMFAMLAFYVASAAFRAFRAKNFEAGLLLGTAFVILLGRTYLGTVLTDWIPDESAWSVLRMDNLTVLIMSVFNTAGTRAIMIGIALGIASTSLKVLLGIDRSYLGSGE